MLTSAAIADIEVWDDGKQSCRMRKKAVQQGRSEQRGESYYLPYVESLNEASTPLADVFRILLERLVRPVTERRSLCMLALAQCDVFLDIHGELNRFKPGSFV